MALLRSPPWPSQPIITHSAGTGRSSSLGRWADGAGRRVGDGEADRLPARLKRPPISIATVGLPGRDGGNVLRGGVRPRSSRLSGVRTWAGLSSIASMQVSGLLRREISR